MPFTLFHMGPGIAFKAVLQGSFSLMVFGWSQGLFILGLNRQWTVNIAWWVTFLSAFAGCYSHVLIDGLMHEDMEPLFPFSPANPLLHALSDPAIHKLCVYSGLAGGVVYFAVQWIFKRRRSFLEP